LIVCPWSERDLLDYVFICPILIVLALNVYFLLAIMFVLITKLRASTSAESRQYRKAAKALLVLIPLLGLTYVLLLVIPAGGHAKVVFTYLQAALYSTQGLLVAVFYCFLNAEVRQCLRLHVARWRTHRLLSHRPATSARGSNASHTTGADSTRHDSSAFAGLSEANESGELRLPLRSLDSHCKFDPVHDLETAKTIGFRHSSVDIQGRTRPLIPNHSRLSVSKRLIDFLHRCRRMTMNRTSESKASTITPDHGLNPAVSRPLNPAHNSSPTHQDTCNEALTNNLSSDTIGKSSPGTPLNLTTKISIEINCNQKPVYTCSPVHVTYLERPL
jgi:hypothetical protein